MSKISPPSPSPLMIIFNVKGNIHQNVIKEDVEQLLPCLNNFAKNILYGDALMSESHIGTKRTNNKTYDGRLKKRAVNPYGKVLMNSTQIGKKRTNIKPIEEVLKEIQRKRERKKPIARKIEKKESKL